MPKPNDQETKVPETTPLPDGGVEVTLEKEEQQEVPEQQPKETPAKPAKPEDDVSKLKNQLGYQQRQMEKLQRTIEELKSPRTPEPAPAPTDELDDLVQKDWKAAVERIADRKFEERQRAIQQRAEQEQVQTRLEKNLKRVAERHPELEDGTSEKSQIWYSIMEKNPELKTSPEGALVVMFEMEQELKARGYGDETPQKAKEEANRIVSARQANLPPSRSSASQSNKIVLTREQKEFCDLNNISYENYAKTSSRINDREVQL